jgi:hypothetical protein
MQEAARRGWLKPLGWVSGGAGRHGRPVRLWASRICESGHPGSTLVDPARVALDRAEPEVPDLDSVWCGPSRELVIAPEADEPRGVGTDALAHSGNGSQGVRL